MDRFLKNTLTDGNKSVLLIGPRQTGKSTLLKSLEPELILNLASEAVFLECLSRPSHLEELVRASKPKSVFVDEVQRLPSLLNTVQFILDDFENPPRFFLSGSSARKLKRGKANLLPGRILDYRMGALSILELGKNWDTHRAMSLGTLPEPYLTQGTLVSQKILESYSGTYLKEEIQIEAERLNLEGFSRFLIHAAEFSGSILDFTKIANRSKISRTSCKRYYEILEDSLVVYRCDPWVIDPDASDMIRHPRFYFFDPGVWNGFLRNFIPSEDRKGALFEHLVISQLYNAAYATDTPIEVYWIRNRSGREVDFVVRFPRSQQVIPIEVKTGDLDNAHLKGLEWFLDLEKKAEGGFLVYPKLSHDKKIGRVTVTTLEGMIRKIFAAA